MNQRAVALLSQAQADQAAGRLDAALQACDAAIAADPAYAPAHNTRGLILQAQGRYAQAADAHRVALEHRPNHLGTLVNLGAALQQLGRLDEAAAAYRAALATDPANARAHANLGLTLQAQGDLVAALGHHQAAVEAEPASGDVLNNLGLCLQALGRVAEAQATFERAVASQPSHAGAHFSLSLVRLLQGEFDAGWAEYGWRPARQGLWLRRGDLPIWRGEDLAGRTILVQAEQGLGDAIQFVRYVPRLAALGARVLLECRPPLKRLFETLDAPIELVDDASQVRADLRVPLLDLPGLFRTTLDNIPAETPYLHADPARVEAWRARLPHAGLKVGLVWRGNPAHANDRNRSAPPASLAAAFDRPGLTLVSLQKDATPAELAAFPAILDAGPDLADLAETAALIRALDLVVSVDTAPLHLAGALGAPAIGLIAFAPDWRWLLGRDDSPWYPSLRLIRQPKPGDWTSIATTLRERLAEARSGRHH